MRYLEKLGMVLAVVFAVVVGILGARWLIAKVAPPPTQALEPGGSADFGPADLTADAIIRNLQEYLRTRQADGVAYTNLGVAYLQKARETGDPTYYSKAEGALHRAYELLPSDYRTLSGLGVLALVRHQFGDALNWGRQAQAFNPERADIYGIIGDAQIELGQYPEAIATFDKMVSLRPDLLSYARVSYARELLGDRPGAISAMQQAVMAGGQGTEAANWAQVQLGNLYFDQGDFGPADAAYQGVLNSKPTYPYAQAGLANVLAARGDYERAIQIYEHLVDTFPLPQFVIALGDLEGRAGRPADAEREYQLVDVEQKLYAANGVDIDAEMALFDADHDRNLPAALARARADYARRPSITVADILAWTQYKSGRTAEAQETMKQALRLGTRNALMYYHAGVIGNAAGQRDAAATYLSQALALNPHFSLLYDEPAARLLATLQAASVPAGG